MQGLARAAVLAAGVLTVFLATVGASPAQTANTASGGSVPSAIVSGAASRIADLAEATTMRLTVVLLPKRDALAAAAQAVGDPASPSFHHFLTLAELKAQFMPADADVTAVEAWAKRGGLTETQRWPTNHAIVVQGTVGQVNALLNVKIGQYRMNNATYYANDRAPTISPDVAGKIADILGHDSLGRFHPSPPNLQGVAETTDVPTVAAGPFLTTASGGQSANSRLPHGRSASPVKPEISGPLAGPYIEPEDLWSEQAYNYTNLARFSHCCNPSHVAGGSPIETSIAIIGAHKPDMNDLKGFFGLYNLAWQVTIVGVGGPKCCDDEMTLDTEWSGATSNSLGLENDTAHIYVYAAGADFNSDLLNVWEAALAANKTRVASTSYANAEPNFGGIGQPSISDFTDVTRSMILMGWTLVAASGDSGGDEGCTRGLLVRCVGKAARRTAVAVVHDLPRAGRESRHCRLHRE
jgi:subtilase family serine protease